MEEKNLKNLIYKGIYQDVANGILKPNEIISENKIAEKYGVSKSPVRDAMVELCKDEILKSIPRMGYQVIPVNLKDILNIIDFRVDIEISGLRRYGNHFTDEQIAVLEKITERGMENDATASEGWFKNYEFHTALYSFYENEFALKYLSKLIRQGATFISQYFIAARGKNRELNGRVHMEIVEEIRRGDIEKACKILQSDIESIKQDIALLYGWTQQ